MKRKILFILPIVLMLIILFSTTVSADVSVPSVDIYTPNNSLNSKFAPVIYLVQMVGSAVGVISLMFIGLKYMFVSPEGKAEFKKQMAPFLIGAILVFAASNIVGIIANFAINNVK